MLDIKIKYVLDIKPIEVSDTGDWIDLRAGKDVELEEFPKMPHRFKKHLTFLFRYLLLY